MNAYCKTLLLLTFQLLSFVSIAEQINVKALKFATEDNKTLMQFDVSASPKHRVFVMENPSRLVVDIKNAKLRHGLDQPPTAHPLFAKVRSAIKSDNDLRVVIDLKMPVSSKNFSLTSDNKADNLLVVELADKNSATTKTAKNIDNSSKAKVEEKTTSIKKVAKQESKPIKEKTKIIAIDAGHGGNDPGAHGQNGTEEKTVTFAIAQKLAALINSQSGLKTVMVRKGDYYVGLRERIKIARAAKADLFISIHADAYQDTSVRGASIYTLSTSGASSEAARWLEKTENGAENESDLVSGVKLSDKEDMLKSVLLDLSQTATQQASIDLAANVLKHFDNIGELHKDSVQKAEFLVLKSPDIPSILVETAFISNPAEERNLLSTRYQEKMATAIFKGVRSYIIKTYPENSRMAAL